MITTVSNHRSIYIPTLFAVLSILLTVRELLALELLILLTGFGVVAFLYSYFLKRKEGVKSFFLWFFVVIIGLAIGLYRPEHFNYPLIFHADKLHMNGLPFSLYLNTAKTMAGYIALAFLISLPVIGSPLLKNAYTKISVMLLLPICVISVSYPVLGLNFYAKELNHIVLFGIVNLFTTCVSEEAFMRLIFQREIGRFVNRYTAKRWFLEGFPLILTTLLFTATHIGPSIEATLVYSMAGFSYGLIYVLTKNVWYSVGCHFLVNIIHFTLFTYPIF